MVKTQADTDLEYSFSKFQSYHFNLIPLDHSKVQNMSEVFPNKDGIK